MIRWLSPVLPPPWCMTLFAFLYLGLGAVEWSIRASFDSWDPHEMDPRGILVLLACVFYGVFRVVRFHPACQPKYGKWLRATPWHHAMPLPGGSIAIGLRDVVVVIVFAALATGCPRATPLTCLAVLAAAYIVPLSAINAGTGCFAEAYAVAFGLALTVRVHESSAALTAVVLVLLIITIMGLKRSLRGFPWDTPFTREIAKSFRNTSVVGQQHGLHGDPIQLGFPYDACAPVSPNPLFPFRHATLLSLLLGWIHYVIAWSQSPADRLEMATISYFALPIGMCLVRIVLYWGRYYGIFWPPISLLGRFTTMRPIIPGYDRVLVAPMAALTVAMLLHTVASRWQISLEYGGTITLVAVLFILLGSGPTIGEWRMLGAYRATATINLGQFTKV